jgi:hypothetical protein
VGFRNDSIRGAIGAGNTLGGQIQRDLSEEFYRERRALDAQSDAAHENVNAQASSDILNAVMGGIRTGVGAFNLASGFMGGGGGASAVANPGNLAGTQPGVVPITSNVAPGPYAFGIDPVTMEPVSALHFNVLGSSGGMR